MRWWDQGAVTVEAGSPVVSGIGTAWLGNIAVGDRFSAPGCPAIGVLRVEGDERLVLKSPAASGASGAAYEVLRQSEDDVAGVIAAFARLVKAEAMGGARWTWALGGIAKGPSKDGRRSVAGVKLLSPAAWSEAGGARRRRTEAPVVVSPTGGVVLTQWPIALTVGACGCAAGWTRTRFQIARASDPGFASPLYDGAGTTETTLKVYPIITGLGANIIWRVLFIDGAGRETDWSGVAACVAPSAVPVPALVQPAAGASVYPDYRFQVGGFYSWDGAALGSARVQITTAADTGFAAPIYDVPSADFVRVLTETDLQTFADYLWRARFTDDRGRVGAWAAAVAFSTKSAIQKPTAVYPTDGTTGVITPYTLQLSDYVSGDGTALASTEYQIANASDSSFSSPIYTGTNPVTPLSTTPVGSYLWRGRYVDVKGRKSSWSDAATFTLAAAGIAKPVNVVPPDYDFAVLASSANGYLGTLQYKQECWIGIPELILVNCSFTNMNIQIQILEDYSGSSWNSPLVNYTYQIVNYPSCGSDLKVYSGKDGIQAFLVPPGRFVYRTRWIGNGVYSDWSQPTPFSVSFGWGVIGRGSSGVNSINLSRSCNNIQIDVYGYGSPCSTTYGGGGGGFSRKNYSNIGGTAISYSNLDTYTMGVVVGGVDGPRVTNPHSFPTSSPGYGVNGDVVFTGGWGATGGGGGGCAGPSGNGADGTTSGYGGSAGGGYAGAGGNNGIRGLDFGGGSGTSQTQTGSNKPLSYGGSGLIVIRRIS